MHGDFAYDMFLRWDSSASTPQCEVMVWGQNNSWPIGTPTAYNVLSAGGYTFDLWVGMNPRRAIKFTRSFRTARPETAAT